MAETVRERSGGFILLLTGTVWADAARRVGVPFVMEGYIDLDYNDQGQLILERAKKARDPEAVAERAVAPATEGKGPGRDGGGVPPAAPSVFVPRDGGEAPAHARAPPARLVEAGGDV